MPENKCCLVSFSVCFVDDVWKLESAWLGLKSTTGSAKYEMSCVCVNCVWNFFEHSTASFCCVDGPNITAKIYFLYALSIICRAKSKSCHRRRRHLFPWSWGFVFSIISADADTSQRDWIEKATANFHNFRENCFLFVFPFEKCRNLSVKSCLLYLRNE